MKIFDNEKKQWVALIEIDTEEITYTEDEEKAFEFGIEDYNYYVFALDNPEARFGRPKDRQPHK